MTTVSEGKRLNFENALLCSFAVSEGSISLCVCYCQHPNGFSWSSGSNPLLSSPGQCGTHSLAPQIPWEGAGGLTFCQSDRYFNLMKWIHAALSFRAIKFRYNSQNLPRASTLLPFSPHRSNLRVIIVLKKENDFFFLKEQGRMKQWSKGPTQKAENIGAPTWL